LADEPGSGGVARRTPVDLPTGSRGFAAHAGLATAALLIAVWLIVDPHTPDLAAQVYRVEMFRQLGFAVWDEHWYAGHHLPGYSLLFPPLGSLLGIRLLGALSVLASVALFERIVRTAYGRPVRLAVAWFAVMAVSDVWVGRVAFALGVALALAAVLAVMRGRPTAAAVLAALCAAASPVAGALLGLAALSAALSRRSPRILLTLAAPAAAIVLALALLFAEGGFEPYPIRSFLATALVVVAFLWALPPDQRLLRVGGLLYLLACLACLLVHSPIGSNIERYGVLLAGPLLLLSRPRPSAAAAAALCAAAVWGLWGPVRETVAVGGGQSTRASYYAPVERFLAGNAAGPVRVEVPLTRSHWEAALLAPTVSLARGWEKQLDERYDAVLLGSQLTAASYLGWLREQAVAYVAVPDAPLDASSAREGRLIARGLPYLREVFTSTHWRVYQVLGATPLASGPGRLTKLGHDSFALHATSAGGFLLRLRFTRYWRVLRGSGCVRRAPGGWTSVTAQAPGTLVVAARFSLATAFGSIASCARHGSL
jgi:hypothetical protein